MARSGSKNFSLTRDQLIRLVFKQINATDLNDAIDSTRVNHASDILNLIIKAWQAEGLKLWQRKEATLFTAVDTASYNLGLTGTHATKSYNSTQLNGAHSSSATTLTVDSTTSMTVGDNIGIELTAGTRYWTTIATIPSSTSLTITSGLTSAASDNGTVVAYTNKIDRPLEIIRATYFDLTDTNLIEIPIDLLRHEQYFNVADKRTPGPPTQAYYDKQLDLGVLYFWPRPDHVKYAINFTFHEALDDMDSGSNDFAFPAEWGLALLWNLAEHLAFPLGQYPELEKIEKKAMYYKQRLEDYNAEDANFQFMPDLRNY